MTGNFKIIILVVFMIAAVLGIFIFSGAIPVGGNKNSTGASGTVVLWGTVDSSIINSLLEDFGRENQDFTVKYVKKPEGTFDSDLLEAFATGKGPDMFLVSNDLLFKYSNKIFTIPYQSLPLATFKNTFIGAGDVFLTSKGILAFPLAVDPLVMYYNRNMLDSNSVVSPPSYWDELSSLVPVLTKKNDTKTIVKSAVAMGQFSNVLHAKDVLATLFMQAGNPIVKEDRASFVSTLNDEGKYDLGSALKFYTDFTDPLKSVYSWNRSFGNSQDAFSREDLAFYFGFASEVSYLINKNPNQNFGMAPMPQLKTSGFKLTSSRVLGIAISASSKNSNTAFVAGNLLTSGNFASKFASSLGMSPVRRELMKAVPTDPYSPIFYSSALFAKSWLDPSPKETSNIFQGMVEGVLSNSMTAEQAINDAGSRLGLLLFK